MIDNNLHVEESKEALANCAEILGQLAASCCMPVRSKHMISAFNELKLVMNAIESIGKNDDAAQQCIDGIARFGSKVGLLYATCCTMVKEPLYQLLFKQMNRAHGSLWMTLNKNH